MLHQDGLAAGALGLTYCVQSIAIDLHKGAHLHCEHKLDIFQSHTKP